MKVISRSICNVLGNHTVTGRLYKDKKGNIYIRSPFTLFCLTDPGGTYSTVSGNNPCPTDFMVEELPSGWKITLEQE